MPLLGLPNELLLFIFAQTSSFSAQHNLQCTSKTIHNLCPEFIDCPTSVDFVVPEIRSPAWTLRKVPPITEMRIDTKTGAVRDFLRYVALSTALVNISVHAPVDAPRNDAITLEDGDRIWALLSANTNLKRLHMSNISLHNTSFLGIRRLQKLKSLQECSFQNTGMTSNVIMSMVTALCTTCQLRTLDVSQNNHEIDDDFCFVIRRIINCSPRLARLRVMPKIDGLQIHQINLLKNTIRRILEALPFGAHGIPRQIKTDVPMFYAAV
jgi:hypothetical protein